MLSAGQSVWLGCGSDDMSCTRLSPFTNVTVPPTATVKFDGVKPAAVIVTVTFVGGGVPPPPPPPPPPVGGGGEGVIGLLPPPQASVPTVRMAAAAIRRSEDAFQVLEGPTHQRLIQVSRVAPRKQAEHDAPPRDRNNGATRRAGWNGGERQPATPSRFAGRKGLRGAQARNRAWRVGARASAVRRDVELRMSGGGEAAMLLWWRRRFHVHVGSVGPQPRYFTQSTASTRSVVSSASAVPLNAVTASTMRVTISRADASR